MKLPGRYKKTKPTQISVPETGFDTIIGFLPTLMAATVIMGAINYLGKDTLEKVETVGIESNKRVTKALICARIPLPNIKTMDGEIVAFRKWLYSTDGLLKSTATDYVWQELNFADNPPTAKNAHGLYATRIDPIGVSNNGMANYYLRSDALGQPLGIECNGLVKLSGTVIEHEDGILRAECAKILCIWITANNSYLYQFMPRIYANYPNTPIFVCTRKQVTEALFMIAMRQLIKEQGGRME